MNEMKEYGACTNSFKFKRQLRKSSGNISVRQVLWSLVETSNSQFSLGKFEAVFLFFFPYTSNFCASKAESSPHPYISPNLPLMFVCEKNMSSWLSLTTLDNKQDNELNYFKMKKKIFGKTFNKLMVVSLVFQNERHEKEWPLCFLFKQKLKISNPKPGPPEQ